MRVWDLFKQQQSHVSELIIAAGNIMKYEKGTETEKNLIFALVLKAKLEMTCENFNFTAHC